MRLAKIKLAGFKSFVDPTTFNLPSNLVGIVGPNGCGKSNIIDAVRWVMGESSAKHLRGDSMADVIFNGSTARKPVGQASIELVFDNSQGKLGGQWAQYAEISVKRAVSRDGQSSYYLNGTRCRRKDITDIFLGTGLGPRSYAIIEQGMISRLIEAKPDDLRIFIEEAAGISKYKERRRETENRMQNTRENINRINDLREELGKRLDTLQRQAHAAERYKELKQQERLIKAQLHGLRWRALHEEAAERQRALGRLETTLEAHTADLRRAEAAAEAERESQVEANEHFNQVQGAFYAVGADIARLEQAIRHAKETRAQQEREHSETEAAWTAAQRHADEDQQRISELEAALEVDDERLSEAKERASVSSARLAECEEAMHSWQQAWDGFNHRAAEQVRAAEVERARIEHLENHVKQLRERENRLLRELEAMAPQSLDAEVVALRDDADRARRQVAELDQVLEEVQRELAQTKAAVTDVNARLRNEREGLQAARERFASVEALQAEALGKNLDEVSGWIEAAGLSKARRVAEQLQVEAGWEHAVETVLGFHLEAVCVEGLGDLPGRFPQLLHGRVGLFDTMAAAPNVSRRDDWPLALLADSVRAPWPIDNLFAGVYAAPSLEQALALRGQLAAAESMVTRDGAWIGPNWLRVARATSGETGILGREQLLKALAQEVNERHATITALEEEDAALQERLLELEQRREETQRQRSEEARQLAGRDAQLVAKESQLEQLRSRQARLNAELEEQRIQRETDETDARQARARLDAALQATESHDQEREVLLKQRDTHRLELEDARRQSRADRDTAHEIELRCQSMRTQLRATRDNLGRIQQQLSHLARRREELGQALAGGEQPIVAMAAELEEQLARRVEVEARLGEARRALEDVEHRIRELHQQRMRAESLATQTRQELDRERMAWQELSVRSDTLGEQIREMGYEMEALLAELPEGATDAAWQEEADRIGRAIQRLGAINLAAIEEFAEHSQRKEYLDAQYEDLAQALTTLENAITKIDRETRQRFQETFEKVNAGLQAKFPRLFGGGHAYLELTGEDLLSTGVTVMARPPGKRNSTIHLLSGGEKALTAVALVFSIFDLNPAPFCMLDEVDAPLDEANVGRFCNLVKEMSDRVQFIFITHNKGTMEMAEHLIGVTMQEAGVSRLVAVDVDEAVQLAAAS